MKNIPEEKYKISSGFFLKIHNIMKCVKYKWDVDAIYSYYVKEVISQKLVKLTAKVKVIGETDKSYWVRLLEPVRNRCAQETMYVRKENIKMTTPNPNKEPGNYWWNALD